VTPRPTLLLFALTYREERVRDEVLARIEGRFGPIRAALEPFPFTFTRYYEEEMGPDLLKQVVVFVRPVHPGFLPRLKLASGRTEDELKDPVTGHRRVNLDPGYITPSALVLASTKGAPHRVYMGLGIYGETTLVYHEGEYRPLPWTYPDFRQGALLRFLGEVRTGLVRELRAAGLTRPRRVT
jgi:hypothetical protein